MTRWVADEVIDGNLTTRKQLVALHSIGFQLDGGLSCPRRCFASLFGILTGCTEGTTYKLGGSCMKTALAFRGGENALSQQPLDALHANVAQAIVPTQQLLLGFREVDVRWLGQGRVVPRRRGPILVRFLTFVGNQFGSSKVVALMVGFLPFDDLGRAKRKIGHCSSPP